MPMIYETGPYLNAAVLCERAIQENDGTITLVRIIDKLTQTARGPEVPSEMPPGLVNLTLALMFKAGEARGRHMVHIRVEGPSGQRRDGPSIPITFSGAAGSGANVLGQFNILLEHEGLYWIDVFLGEHLLTRTPLLVEYRPEQTP